MTSLNDELFMIPYKICWVINFLILSPTEWQRVKPIPDDDSRKGWYVFYCEDHKTAASKEAGITLRPFEYRALDSYVRFYRPRFPEQNCNNSSCPLFQNSFIGDFKSQSENERKCRHFTIGNIHKVSFGAVF